MWFLNLLGKSVLKQRKNAAAETLLSSAHLPQSASPLVPRRCGRGRGCGWLAASFRLDGLCLQGREVGVVCGREKVGAGHTRYQEPKRGHPATQGIFLTGRRDSLFGVECSCLEKEGSGGEQLSPRPPTQGFQAWTEYVHVNLGGLACAAEGKPRDPG